MTNSKADTSQPPTASAGNHTLSKVVVETPKWARWICFCGAKGFATAISDPITGEPMWSVKTQAIKHHDQHAKREYGKVSN